MSVFKFGFGQISVCLTLNFVALVLFSPGSQAVSDPNEPIDFSTLSSMGSGFGQGGLGNLGGLGGFGGMGGLGNLMGGGGLFGGGGMGGGGMGGHAGHGHHDNHDHHGLNDQHAGQDTGEDYMDFGEFEDDDDDENDGDFFGLDMGSIIGLMKAASGVLKHLPDVDGLLSTVMSQGYNYVRKFMTSLPAFTRRIRPEIRELFNDVKKPLRDMAGMAMKMKSRLLGPKAWGKNSVDLDLLERALSFCPGVNMTDIERKSRASWDSFEFQFLDRCVELGCDGKYDLCCPYIQPNNYAVIQSTCVYSLKKHFGKCPKGYKETSLDQADIQAIMSTSEAFPTCNIDANCKVTEKCCMKEDRSKDATSSHGSCKEAKRK